MDRDYNTYRFGKKELWVYGICYLFLSRAVSWLFYRSLWPIAVMLPGFPLFLKDRKKGKIQEQKDALLVQFLTGIRAVSNGLNAGYSIENAMEEALKETKKVYGEDGLLTGELEAIVQKLKLNFPLEALLEDLGKRSHLEDMESFGEIFAVARRSGGNMNRIIQSTADSISQKAKVQQEIAVSLAAKQMEQKIMSLIPFFILAYVNLASPEFLEGLYDNPVGIGIMTSVLAVYGVAFAWGRRIVRIEV